MTLREVKDYLNGEVLLGEEHLNEDFQHAFGSDLMSDVLAFVEHDTILITGLVNLQVIRTAYMLDLRAIVFVRGKIPAENVLALAREYDMIVLCTKYSMYTTSGILYKNGLAGTIIDQ